MICPKCGYSTGEETCPSCGVIFAKIHIANDLPVSRLSPREKPFAWDVLTIKILWIGNLIYFNVQSIGVTGEGNFFYAIFNIAMAFPLSLALIPLGRLIGNTTSPGDQGSGNDVNTTLVVCMAVLVIGYLQWFIIIPRLARAGWWSVDKVAERSPKAGTWLEKAVNVVRVLLPWRGAGYFLVLALRYLKDVPLAVLFFSGAVAVFLVFRPRKSPPGWSRKDRGVSLPT